jgi:LDH2 family malate/lactate/ureidoglycolate dehydrogenase
MSSEDSAQPTSWLLDPDSAETVRLNVEQAKALGLAALQRVGYPADEAAIIVDQLVDNALCGYKFAGLPRILAIAGDRKTREKRSPVRVVHETPVSATLDGGNNVGYIAAYRAAEVAIEKTRAMGIAAVGAYNSYFSGRNAYFVERIVREGFFALHTASGQPHVLPPGAAAPALGTNPISFGFPTTEAPVIVDFGTAALMWGEVMLHARLGLPLPPDVGFDREGAPTTDASEALKGGVGAFGGYKGYALSLAIQAMGLLAGAQLVRNQPLDYGFFFFALDPAIMLPNADFREQMSAFVQAIKATPRKPGTEAIRIPSERAFQERERRRQEGIVLERKVVDALEAL